MGLLNKLGRWGKVAGKWSASMLQRYWFVAVSAAALAVAVVGMLALALIPGALPFVAGLSVSGVAVFGFLGSIAAMVGGTGGVWAAAAVGGAIVGATVFAAGAVTSGVKQAAMFLWNKTFGYKDEEKADFKRRAEEAETNFETAQTMIATLQENLRSANSASEIESAAAARQIQKLQAELEAERKARHADAVEKGKALGRADTIEGLAASRVPAIAATSVGRGCAFYQVPHRQSSADTIESSAPAFGAGVGSGDES